MPAPLPARSPRPRPRAPVLPQVEELEGRCVPAPLMWYLSSGASAGQFAFGGSGWLAVAGDWRGTGQAGVGAFDPATATWYLRNETGAGAPDAGQFRYGAPGWVPVTGDWHNSGHTGIGIFDPATATWFLRNEVNAGPPDAGRFAFGVAGGIPVVGDWTGTGHLGIGVFDPATGTWYLRSSATPGWPDAGVFQFGGAGWAAAAGPVVGHGRAGIGVVDPATGTWYLRSTATPGWPDAGQLAFGGSWLPVPGAFPPAQSLLAAGGSGPVGPGVGPDLVQSAVAAELARLSAAGVGPALANLTSASEEGIPYWTTRNSQNEDFLDEGGQADVLFLGDSITENLAGGTGAGQPVWNSSFAPLGAADFAIAGAGTAQVLWQVEQGQVARASPSVVVLLNGAADLLEGRGPPEVAAALAKIVGEIRGQLPDTRVLLLGVLPLHQRPADPLRGEIAQLNGLLANLDDGDRVRFLDIGGRFLLPDGTISPLVMPDFTHPSLLGYQVYADAVGGTLTQMLNAG